MKKETLLAFLSIILISPLLAFAQAGGNGGGGLTIQGMVDAVVQTTFYIASGVVVILWVITGILFLTARGAPDQLSKAKTALIAAVVGTFIVIVAGSAISIVRSAFGLNSGS